MTQDPRSPKTHVPDLGSRRSYVAIRPSLKLLPADVHRKVWVPYVVLVLGFLLTLIITQYVRRTLEDELVARDQEMARATVRAVDERLQRYEDTLHAATSLFAVHPHVTADDFGAFCRELALPGRYRGAEALAYSARVQAIERQSMINAMRAQGFDTFDIWPATQRDVAQPITYIEPRTSSNLALLGFDMASEPARRSAMEQAGDSGEPTATSAITLMHGDSSSSSFMLYAPVYHVGRAITTIAQRRAALRGFVAVPFGLAEFFDGIFSELSSSQLALDVVDATDTGEPLLYRNAIMAERRRVPDVVLIDDVAGRSWKYRFWRPSPTQTPPGDYLVMLTFLGGTMVSLVFFALVLTEARARTRSERHTADVRRSEEALREANRAKDEFLAMLGHELRNPLAATRTALELVREAGLHDRDAIDALDVAQRQVRHQARLVDDLLDASRVGQGKITLRPKVLDLVSAVGRLVNTLQPAATRKQQTIVLHSSVAHAFVYGDPVRLDQVFTNLLTNAIKYNRDQGTIDVTIDVFGDTAHVRLSDQGIGIEPDALSKIFELFAQVGTSLDRSSGGLGIGLTLARRLVELHGGTICAHSRGRGMGSEFLVTLPLTQRSPAAVDIELGEGDGAKHRSAGPLRILLVEDNQDSSFVLQRLLRRWGHEVEVASDGESGLEAAFASRPDAALVDLGLPTMDGFEVAERLRRRFSPEQLLLVAVSGYGQAEDLRRSRAAGFDEHLVKPVDPNRLKELLSQRALRINDTNDEAQTPAAGISAAGSANTGDRV